MAKAWNNKYGAQSQWAGAEVQVAGGGWITNSADVQPETEAGGADANILACGVDDGIVRDAAEKKARRDFYGAFTERTLAKICEHTEGDTAVPEKVMSIEREKIPEWRRWVDLTHHVPDASARLFCFPWAGGSSVAFDGWSRRLPGVEVVSVHLPGRNARAGEAALTSVDDIITMLVEALCGLHLLSYGGISFCVFGHELGALLAFEFCRRVHEEFPADALFVSGLSCPQMVHVREKLSTLCQVSPEGEVLHSKNSEFEDAVRRRGEIPPEVSENKDLMELFTPLWYADFSAMDTYEYHSGPLLECPIYSFGGKCGGGQNLEGWAMETSSNKNATTLYPGGCFYLLDRDNEASLLHRIQEFVREKRDTVAVSAATRTVDAVISEDDDAFGPVAASPNT